MLGGSGLRVSGQGASNSAVVGDTDEEAGRASVGPAVACPEGSRGFAASGHGRRKSVVLAGGSAGFRNGSAAGSGYWTGPGERLGGVGDGRMGRGWGKWTAPRVIAGGNRSVFRTSPEECYFRASSAAGRVGRQGGVGAAPGDVEEGTDAGAGPGALAGTGRAWPSVRDAELSGRCSLAIVIRESGGTEEVGDGAGCPHRPTHRVTRQVSGGFGRECLCTSGCPFPRTCDGGRFLKDLHPGWVRVRHMFPGVGTWQAEYRRWSRRRSGIAARTIYISLWSVRPCALLNEYEST